MRPLPALAALALLVALVLPGAALALGPGPPPPVSTVLDAVWAVEQAACAPLGDACGTAFGVFYSIVGPLLPQLPP